MVKYQIPVRCVGIHLDTPLRPRIHVCYIYLHLLDFYVKCRDMIYTIHGSYGIPKMIGGNLPGWILPRFRLGGHHIINGHCICGIQWAQNQLLPWNDLSLRLDSCTPLKSNKLIQKMAMFKRFKPFSNHHFGYPCKFSRVYYYLCDNMYIQYTQ